MRWEPQQGDWGALTLTLALGCRGCLGVLPLWGGCIHPKPFLEPLPAASSPPLCADGSALGFNTRGVADPATHAWQAPPPRVAERPCPWEQP